MVLTQGGENILVWEQMLIFFVGVDVEPEGWVVAVGEEEGCLKHPRLLLQSEGEHHYQQKDSGVKQKSPGLRGPEPVKGKAGAGNWEPRVMGQWILGGGAQLE